MFLNPNCSSRIIGPHKWCFCLAILVLVLPLLSECCFAEKVAPTRQELDFFESKIRPILIQHCYECHSKESGESEGDLFLDSAAAMMRGGSMGAVLVKGKPGESLLVRAIEYRDRDLQMPPANKLAKEEIESIRRWISMGAPDPRTEEALPVEAKVSPKTDSKEHWAFMAPKKAVPTSSSHHAKDVIDVFAANAASENKIKIAEPADRETLVRRLYFDLIGIAPSREQITAFENDKHPAAYARLVDELLASPEFAERFARHWMDVARYADTVGYALGGRERRIKGSERYRDWLIRSFANDLPYDQMIMHQLAADRTDPKNAEGHLDAMGFLTIGRTFLNPLDVIDDRIDVITRGLQGLTVACARCHDHKFDPIPTSDYYSLFGVLDSSVWKKDGASPLMMQDKPKPGDRPILVRGQRGNRGPIAPRQFLTALRKPDDSRFKEGSGRYELAKRIASKDNPLTSRVLVNRVWGQLIGKPLIDSPSDFGVRTRPPVVPELLDDLAAEFAIDWSIKRLVRRIVMTRVYRQSAESGKNSIAQDPENLYLGRANRRRRDFESLRDTLLSVSDWLDRSVGGESIEITLPTATSRRSLYAMIDRQNLPSLFRTFDFASPDTHSPQRYFTTVPQQALFLMNSKQIAELASRAADRSRKDAKSQASDDLVVAVFRRVLARDPNEREKTKAIEYLSRRASSGTAPVDSRSLWSYHICGVDDQYRPVNSKPLAIFDKGRWQAEKEFPAKSKNSYAYLGKDGGHPGSTNDQSVVRRFKAPTDGTVRILGTLGHRGKDGDGVMVSVWIGDKRVMHNREQRSNRPFGPYQARVRKGQHIQFVASPGATNSFDTYYWRVKIKLTDRDGQLIEADSVDDFSGPFSSQIKPLDRLGQLAQALFMSNEFAFVD